MDHTNRDWKIDTTAKHVDFFNDKAGALNACNDAALLKEAYDWYKKHCETLRGEITRRSSAKKENILRAKALEEPTINSSTTTNFQVRNTLRGHFGKIYAMQWAQNTDQLVSASQDGNLMIWDGVRGGKRALIPLRSSWVMTCAYSPSGNYVACGGLDNLCTVYPSHSTGIDMAPECELTQHEGYLSCCRFTSDREILTASGDSTCILWDVEEKKVITQWTDHSGDVMSLSHNPTSPFIFVSGSCDTTARIFDVRQYKAVGTFRGHSADINAVQWFPDGKAFATGSDDSSMMLFDRKAYKRLNQYKTSDAICGITSLAFSKTGKYLFSGYDDNPFAIVWDTLLAQSAQSLPGLVRVSCIGVQYQGKAFCTGSWDNLLKIWA